MINEFYVLKYDKPGAGPTYALYRQEGDLLRIRSAFIPKDELATYINEGRLGDLVVMQDSAPDVLVDMVRRSFDEEFSQHMRAGTRRDVME